MNEWKYKAAPSASDIIWELYCTKFSIYNLVFAILLNLILFLFVVVCVTPLSFLNNISAMRSGLKSIVSEKSQIFSIIADQITPIILMLFNYQFIPFLVNKTGEFSDFELKSDKHISNMKKYYFFFFLVTIVLPITGMTTIETFMTKLVSKTDGLIEIHQIITKNLVKTSTFFIRYVLSCTFLSSCFLIFDLGHQLNLLCLRGGCCKRKRTQEEEEKYKLDKTLSASKDLWYFDMGYNIAFTQIIYCTVLIFSQVAPLITPFGCLFFVVKYFIDKYNILYVYPADYNYSSSGRLYSRIIFLQYLGITFSQVIMFGILIAMFGNKYLKACVFIVILQLVFLFIFKIVDYLPINQVKEFLAKDYMDEEDEKQMMLDKKRKIEALKKKMETKNNKLEGAY